MRAVWVAGLVLVLGCSSAVPVPERKAPVAAPAVPAAPVAPDERDLLWALAPESATLGIVVSPRGVAAIERAVTIAQDLFTSSADFAAVQAEGPRAGGRWRCSDAAISSMSGGPGRSRCCRRGSMARCASGR